MINVKNKQLLKVFGDKVRESRLSKNLSQEALANLADIPLSQIGRIERGEINPTLSTMFAIAKALKVTLPEITDVKVKY